ncbi:MAG: cysteine desulfurase NifS [Smithellaceae bacterium]|nr:cysteine desulfurase NifS [Smithellaceae bacterium]
MSMRRVYLDHAATTPVDRQVLAAMLPYFTEEYGNAASLHSFGQAARQAVEEARQQVALFIGARAEEIIFTGGGTESDNLALKGVASALAAKGRHIITSAVEHHAISESCGFLEKEGFRITYLPVDQYGLVDPDDLKKAITDETVIISIMHANNEIGTIQPVAEIGRIAKDRGICFHTDAVQTLGHVPLNVNELNVDMLSASAHKLYGPKGVGLLYVRKGTRINPILHGGEQERKRRPSTQNVPGIVGFGKAVQLAAERMAQDGKAISGLRNRFIREVMEKIGDCRLNGHPELRLPNNANISIEYVEGESLILSLDMEGIACSTGSACSSASLEPSHVLLAIGCSHEMAHGSIRFSLGLSTSDEDIDYVMNILPGVVKRLRNMSPLYKTMQ